VTILLLGSFGRGGEPFTVFPQLLFAFETPVPPPTLVLPFRRACIEPLPRFFSFVSQFAPFREVFDH